MTSKKRNWEESFCAALDVISGIDGQIAFQKSEDYKDFVRECAIRNVANYDEKIREHVKQEIRDRIRPEIRERLESVVRKELETKNSQWDFLIQQHEARRFMDQQKKVQAAATESSTNGKVNALLESILKGNKK